MADSTSTTEGGVLAGDAMPPMPPMGDEPDEISEKPNLTVLHGLTLDYQYSTGRHYQLIFDKQGSVRFAWLNHPPYPGGVEFVAPTIPYRSREIRDGLIQIHWIIKQAAIHVSILIDFTAKKLYTSCMMPPNRWEFWDDAEILEVTES